MKKLFSKKVLIGIFTVAVLAISYWGLNFLKSKRIFSNDNVIYATFPQADGLEVSAPVLVKGFRIGTVEKISFDIRASQVLVRMTLNDEYPLPFDSKAEITSTSIIGGKVMEVKLGVDESHTLQSGDTIRTIFAPGIAESLGQEYGKLKATANEIIEKLNSALDGINQVLSPENTKAISSTLANLQSVSGNVDQMINDERANITKIISNLSALSASLKTMAPQIERGINNFALLSDSLAVQGPALIANAAGSIDNLNQILNKVDNGTGSVGKLINDAELYNNLNLAVESLNMLMQDLQTNPKKYVNITVFGKKEKK